MDQRVDTKWRLTSKDGLVQHLLTPGMIFIGRQECDIVVDCASVDKRHAVIFFNPGDRQFHVKDLNSVTGTYLNGTRIPEQTYVKLSNMDCLRFGYGHEVFYVRKGHEGPFTPEATLPKSPAVKICVDREENSSPPSHHQNSPSSCSPHRQSPCISSPTGTAPKAGEEPVPPPRETSNPPSPHSPCEGEPSVLQDADSLEDLSKTEEESLSTVREVLPKPPRPPNTLSWKPLPPTPKLRQMVLQRDEATKQMPLSTSDDATECSPPMLNNESPLIEAASLPSSSASPVQQSPVSAEQHPSTVSSTAFTIPFDDDTASGRRFSLKDGIKKFAPPKPSSNRPTTWLRASSARSVDVSASKKGSLSPMDLCIKSGDGRRQWSMLESGREGSERNSLDDLRGPSDGLTTKHSGGDERLTDSASYLIQRMLSDSPFSPASVGEKLLPQSSLVSDSKRGGEALPPLSPGDDRSDTGTYTVGTEKVDPVVEEARKKIDEVFGVVLLSRVLPSNVDAKLKQGSHTSYQLACSGDSESSSPKHARDGSSPAGRPKRRLPTPPSERPPLEVFDAGTFTRRSTGTLERPPASPQMQRVQGRRVAPATLASVAVDGKPSLRPLPAPQKSSDVVASSARPPQRRRPWVPCSSEVDLVTAVTERCASEETASVVSDTSTEPSSHSSGSQGGPQMKLNRAFALRRARLGLGDTGVGTTTPAKKRTSSPHHGSNPNLSRQDGGRYSLRLSRGVPGGHKTPVAVDRAALFRVKTSIKGAQLASTSDTERSSPHPRHDERTSRGRASCFSDGEGGSASPANLGRSASFGAGDDTIPPEVRGPSRGDTFLRTPPSGTFVRSRGDKKSTWFGKGLPAKVQEVRGTLPSSVTGSSCSGPEFFCQSGAPVENGNKTPSSTGKRELSALDSLVISAIFQLSGKLRANARSLIERERFKYPENSDARLMIEELLPSVAERRSGDSPPEGNLTRELSSILKNLKRTEQSLDVLNSLVSNEGSGASSGNGSGATTETAMLTKKPSGRFFYVDV